MKSYVLTMRWLSGYKVKVRKEFPSDRKAKFWAQLCVDICGKDEHGVKFSSIKLEGTKTPWQPAQSPSRFLVQ